MGPCYDVAVVGTGTMGSFATCELARRGVRVIGFDHFTPPHGRGSHSGDTRIFRAAYGEHHNYVPLALRAGILWDEYSERGKVQLLTRSGMLTIGSPQSEFIGTILKSSALHRIETIQYSSAQLKRLFPAFSTDDSQVGILERGAGWLNANLAIETALQLAQEYGAKLQFEDPILRWSYNRDHFEIATAREIVLSEKLIVTAGAWTTQILNQLGLPLQVQRKILTWITPLDGTLFQPAVFPIFAFGDNFLYGFPDINRNGVKLAVHWTPGKPVSDPASVAEGTTDDAAEPLRIAASLLPKLAGPMPEALRRVRQVKTCLYVNSHDGHFFLDRHPDLTGLFLAAGFSGHGFKFAPAIGEALAEMATTGGTTLSLGFLGLSRLGRAG